MHTSYTAHGGGAALVVKLCSLLYTSKVDKWGAGVPGTTSRCPGLRTRCAQIYLTESVYKVVLQQSIPAQIRRLILYYYLHKESVVGFVRELTFAKRLDKHFV